MSKISIIIPVYYSEDTLMDLYLDLHSKILNNIGPYELVFVDDGSKDSSWDILRQISTFNPNVKLVKLSRNFGEHAAILAGLSVCTGDCAVTKQADLQEPAELILEMYAKWKEGNKVVLASRKSRDESKLKVFFANQYYNLMRKYVNRDMPDGGCDCYLVDRKVIDVLINLDEKNSSMTLQVMWAGFKTAVVPFDRLNREKGESRWTLSKKIKLAIDSMLSFSYVPIRFMIGVGVVFNIFAVLLFVSVLVEFFAIGTPIAGWSSLMCVVLLSSGLILITLGVLGEYLWRTLDAARPRPVYIIDELIESL